MKRILFAAALVAASAGALAADVDVSVRVREPGFYGRVDIGHFPRPQVIYPEPIVIQPVPVGVMHEPIYLHVPPGHAKHWHKHCRKYNACGRPVYFVQERWYNDVVVRHHHGKGHHKGHGKRHKKDRDDDDD